MSIYLNVHWLQIRCGVLPKSETWSLVFTKCKLI